MYAIVEIAGQQFKVEAGRKIFVHRIDAEEGENVAFEKVLLVDNEGVITIGEPVIENTVVECKILAHVRGDKVIVFKKKRRKGYQKRNGHRQDFTQVEILSIGPGSGTKKKAAPKAEKKEEAPVAAEVKVTEVQPEVKEEVKKTSAAKAPAKKAPAAKAPAAKAPAKKAPAAKKETAEKKEPAAKKPAPKKAPAKSPKKTAKE